MRDPKRNRSNLQSSLLNAAQVRLNVINRFKTAPIASSCSFKTAMWRFPDHRGWKLHARKTGWLVERTEREDPISATKRRGQRRTFVQRISRRAHPVPPPQRIPFLPTADWLSSLLFALPSLHGFVADVWALSLSREKMAYLGRFQRPDAATSPKGDHQSSTSPGTWIFAFFFFFFTLSFFLSSIGFRKKWKGDDKSCSLCFLFVLDREKERIPVSDSVWVNLTTIGDFIMRLIIGYILVALCLGGIFSVDL